jgi:hypothetical protein
MRLICRTLQASPAESPAFGSDIRARPERVAARHASGFGQNNGAHRPPNRSGITRVLRRSECGRTPCGTLRHPGETFGTRTAGPYGTTATAPGSPTSARPGGAPPLSTAVSTLDLHVDAVRHLPERRGRRCSVSSLWPALAGRVGECGPVRMRPCRSGRRDCALRRERICQRARLEYRSLVVVNSGWPVPKRRLGDRFDAPDFSELGSRSDHHSDSRSRRSPGAGASRCTVERRARTRRAQRDPAIDPRSHRARPRSRTTMKVAEDGYTMRLDRQMVRSGARHGRNETDPLWRTAAHDADRREPVRVSRARGCSLWAAVRAFAGGIRCCRSGLASMGGSRMLNFSSVRAFD